MIEGLSHMTFIVRDLDRMSEILSGVFGAREVYSSEDDTFSVSREKFFLIGDIWVAVMEGEALPVRTYNHIAFKIDEADFDLHVQRIESLGLDMRPPRPRVEGEGRSIYFYDHDNHLFELHTGTLAERLARYGKGKEAAQ
ncbi:FosX/FosE/FosI family fosfomycin resistance hydrolase [Chelativorans sp. YIM 93263]|uniref:FosX/FosE/FosI family fosfomycin resistance hydrolase n=1 Tax=Chelativorans sp. YIM 93263 TaxID=2906648 RepID=UPI0023792DF2|nr:FosX/FosE/FosI family fosfomycin resistance hydrolase [Chelativorans sp. YIM 93263]